ncbi:hypothetical protein JCM17960_11060 [Magnetospira thiophila]
MLGQCPAYAESVEIPDAQTLIDACWKKSEEFRSTENTSAHREGFYITTLCLEEEIINNSSIFIYDGVENKKSLSVKFSKIRSILIDFYWNIYNENNACMPSCGTQHYSTHLFSIAKIYEEILKDIILQRKNTGQEGLPIDPSPH